MPTLSINLLEARERLGGVRRHAITSTRGDGYRLGVAVPVSYDKQHKHRYPLVVLLDSCDIFGSAIEMSRLMAQTKEITECVLVAVEAPTGLSDASLAQFLAEELLPWCSAQMRIDASQLALFSPRAGRAAEIQRAALTSAQVLTAALDDADAVAAFTRGLRAWLSSGHQYGTEVVPMQQPLLMHALGMVRPLIRALRRAPAKETRANPYRLHSEQLQRDFEVFAALPASTADHAQRRYPALLVLDASIEFSTVAETAARLAAVGLIEEIAVIGIGVPRSEGPMEFAFRRFEEFSPPAQDYAYDDALGRIFRSLFALRGQDARKQLGRAPDLYRFIRETLLPQLLSRFPIDDQQLGILGHSAGGTFVSYALEQADTPFRNYAAVSPGIGISGSWLLRQPHRLSAQAQKVFLCIGSEERDNRFNQIAGIPYTPLYAEALRAQGSVTPHYVCYDGETHSSVYPRAAADALLHFYRRTGTSA